MALIGDAYGMQQNSTPKIAYQMGEILPIFSHPDISLSLNVTPLSTRLKIKARNAHALTLHCPCTLIRRDCFSYIFTGLWHSV